jgi:NAD(P) transhydrogenase
MVVLGAGVIGIEYASIFAALRMRVMLVDTRDRLLPYADREIVDILEEQLTALGIHHHHADTYQVIQKRAGDSPVRARLSASSFSLCGKIRSAEAVKCGAASFV